MSDQVIISVSDSGTMEVIMNFPSKMNCMGVEMLDALQRAASDAEKDPQVKVVLFKGAGEKAFSTGANLKEFNALNDEEAYQWILRGNNLFNQVENISKPTIAYINGYAMGGGLELALACDFRVGTANTILCSAELRHGWLPGWGGLGRLRRLIGEARAKEMIMLNTELNAQQAFDWGLLTRIDDGSGENLKSLIDHLSKIRTNAFAQAKVALQNQNWSTYGSAIHYDALSVLDARRSKS